MIYRAFFKTAAIAQREAATAIDRLKAEYVAAVGAAGVSPATPAPLATATVLSVEELPIGAAPSGTPAQARVRWRIETSGGRVETVEATMPKSAAEAVASPASAQVTVTATTKATIRAVARFPSVIQVTVTGGGTTELSAGVTLPSSTISVVSTAGFPTSGKLLIGDQLVAYTGLTVAGGTPQFTGCSGGTGAVSAGTSVLETCTLPNGVQVQDPVTGKRYKTGVEMDLVSGKDLIQVSEVSSSEAGDVSHGTILRWLPQGLSARVQSRLVEIAVVVRIASAAVTHNSELVDPATGRRYRTSGLVVLTDTDYSISGDLAGTVDIVRDTTDGVDDVSSVEVGTELHFDPSPWGIVTNALVTRKALVTLPSGTRMKRVTGSLVTWYRTTLDTSIYDRLEASAPIVAEERGSASNLMLGATLTVDPPVSGVSTTATVTEVTPWAAYPEAYAPQQVGAELVWDSRVFPQGGEWVAEIFTVPYGS